MTGQKECNFSYLIWGHLGVLVRAEDVVAVIVKQPESGLGVLNHERMAEFRVREGQELVDVQLGGVGPRGLSPRRLRRRHLFLQVR